MKYLTPKSCQAIWKVWDVLNLTSSYEDMLLFDLFEKPCSFPKYLSWRHRQDLNLHCEIRMTKRMQIYSKGSVLMILGIPDTEITVFLIPEALLISGHILLYLQNSKWPFHLGSLLFFWLLLFCFVFIVYVW